MKADMFIFASLQTQGLLKVRGENKVRQGKTALISLRWIFLLNFYCFPFRKLILNFVFWQPACSYARDQSNRGFTAISKYLPIKQ